MVRRRPGTADAEVTGALYGERWHDGKELWTRLPFRAASRRDAPTGRSQAALDRRLRRAVNSAARAASVAAIRRGARACAGAGRAQAGRAARIRPVSPTVRTDLSQLMDTTTGVMSMQEALQHDRGLRVDRSDDKPTIAIGALSLPPLDAHPFAAMQARLPDPAAGTPEPLAAAVPAEFWYARVDDIRLMLRLMDEADAWMTPVVQILQRNPEDRHLADRYQAQLGLRRTDMARLFGHTVVGQVALTGSDPYLREGSDVTMIFAVKQQAIFDQELAGHLEAFRAEVPGLVTATRDHNGVTISESRDPGGTVRQQRAQLGELAIVSNSPRACEKVIDAIQGKTARLGDEPDLKYMLARDPGTHQAFAFLSDKFIAAVVGPRQKVLAARRQLALAELLTPGYAALLHGWLFGAAPASSEALVASGLLVADELRHRDGAAIAFTPGSAASSTWGRPAALTPLIDLPAVTRVSAAEKAAYESFVGGYQQYWKQFIDPVAIRVDVEDTGATSVAQIDVRILPLISATDYSEIAAIVGGTRVHVSAIDRGLQGVWAVGKDARLRTDLDGVMRAATGQGDIGMGWLGDWVLLGIEDGAAIVELMARFGDLVQMPPAMAERDAFNDVEMWRLAGRFPLYAAAEVKNPAMLVATLAAIRTMLGGVAPGMLDWGETARHRDLPIVRVGASKSAPLPNREIADAVALYYVQTGEALVLAIDLEVLRRAVDRVLAGKLPEARRRGQRAVRGRGPLAAGRAAVDRAAVDAPGPGERGPARRAALGGDPHARRPRRAGRPEGARAARARLLRLRAGHGPGVTARSPSPPRVPGTRCSARRSRRSSCRCRSQARRSSA
jgi:hypothetical protein